MPSPQSRRWCFTHNNYSQADIDSLVSKADSTKYLVFGREVAPTTGTPHLQGYVYFEAPKRLSWLRNHFISCHYEIARGSHEDASNYCKKEGDFEEFGSFPSSTGPKKKFLDLIIEWIDQFIVDNNRTPTPRELALNNKKGFIMFGSRLIEYMRLIQPTTTIRDGVPNDWQRGLIEAVDDEPDDRSVLFYVDPEGGKGKTWLQQYLMSTKPEEVQILGVGKRDDLAHAIDPHKRIFLFNVPRGGMEFLQYTILEQLKDRMIFSPKYQSQTKILDTNPHVIVFSNEEPDMEKMSTDRYIIQHLE